MQGKGIGNSLPGGSTQSQTNPTQGRKISAQVNAESDDPDRPPFAQGLIDKEQYLRLRAEHISLLRGLPNEETAILRSRAIELLNRQEIQLRSQKNSDELKRPSAGGPLLSATSWTPLGPTPIPNGQTSDVSTPVSGRTIAIAVHPTNPDVVFVGTAQGGLYKSTNGGDNWTMLFEFDMESLAVGALALSADGNTLYVGTGEPNFSADSFSGRGLYLVGNANTATPTLSGPFGQDVFSGRAISKILVHPADPNTIFVSTTSGVGGNPASFPSNPPPRGLYRSTNALSGSPAFTQLNVTGTAIIADRNVVDLVFEPGNPNILICTLVGATGDGGVYRSVNALSAIPTFTLSMALPNGATNGRAELAINKIDSDGGGPLPAVVTVLAATGEVPTAGCPGTAGQVKKSVDGGVTFSPVPIPGSLGFCGGQCFYDIAIALNPNNMTMLLGGSARGGATNPCSDVQKRSADGVAFARDDGGLHADTHVNVFAPSNPNIAYVGNDGGIWRADNAGNPSATQAAWVSKNNMDFSATQFQDLALHPFDRFFTIGGTQDNGTNCLQPDGTWRRCDYGDGGHALIDQYADDTSKVTMYHTYFNQRTAIIGYGRVFNVAQAQDASWEFRNCGATPIGNGMSCNDNVLFYAPMTIGPDTADSEAISNTVYYGSDRLYRSNNRGFTMELVSQGPLVPSTPAGSGEPISSIGISPQNDNVRIVGLRNGSVFATTAGSTPLTNITSPNFPPPNPADTLGRRYVARAVIDPSNQNTAYITFGLFGIGGINHVFKTTNLAAMVNGTLSPAIGWVPSGNGLPDVPVNSFAVDPQDSNALFAGTDIGVYRSIDGGVTWTPFSEGLPRVAVFDMEIANVQRILRIATHGRGLFERTIPGQQLPIIRNGSVSLINESCPPANGVVDPGERVTVNLSLQNVGPGTTTNLVATLLPTGGVIAPVGAENVSPAGSQSFGSVSPNGGTGTRSFSFTADGSCGATITLTFQLSDGTTNFGTASFSFPLGLNADTAPTFAEDFDDEAPPALPAGWSTLAIPPGGQNWTTTNAFSDSAPNSVAVDASAAFGNLDACAGGSGGTELTTGNISVPMPPATGLNPGAFLKFRNFYNLEAGYDGGVLEISINGGAFQDIAAAGGTFVTGGYNSVLAADPTNPIGGRAAWTGGSTGFITTLIRLPAGAHGQTIQLKWRTGYDGCNTPQNSGLRIDSISVFGSSIVCNSECSIPRIAMSGVTLSCVVGAIHTDVTIQNQGVVAAEGVTLTEAQLGTPPINGSIVPQGPFDLAPGETHSFSLTFGTPCPFTGSKLLRIRGTSTNAGTWSASRNVTSP
jgi:hypothetical protein